MVSRKSTLNKEMIKIFSMQHWETKSRTRNIIPKDEASDHCVNSALAVLAVVHDDEFRKYIDDDLYVNKKL